MVLAAIFVDEAPRLCPDPSAALRAAIDREVAERRAVRGRSGHGWNDRCFGAAGRLLSCRLRPVREDDRRQLFPMAACFLDFARVRRGHLASGPVRYPLLLLRPGPRPQTGALSRLDCDVAVPPVFSAGRLLLGGGGAGGMVAIRGHLDRALDDPSAA